MAVEASTSKTPEDLEFETPYIKIGLSPCTRFEETPYEGPRIAYGRVRRGPWDRREPVYFCSLKDLRGVIDKLSRFFYTRVDEHTTARRTGMGIELKRINPDEDAYVSTARTPKEFVPVIMNYPCRD